MDVFNESGVDQPREISWSLLKLLYVFNLIMAIMAIAVSVNVSVITENCSMCNSGFRTSSYVIMGTTMAFVVICICAQLFALVTQSGKLQSRIF